MQPQPERGSEISPKLYRLDDTHLFLNWIAEGTDGRLYMVPSEPGGWKRRRAYDGGTDLLRPISAAKARAIVKFVGGTCSDWGPVTIAAGSASPWSDPWVASMSEVSTAG